MKKMFKLGMIMFTAIMLVSGCSGKSAKAEAETEPPQTLYPISIDGNEILIGQTTVQALLDQGFNITVSEMTEDKKINKYEVDPEAALEPNTYYSGGSIWITDKIFALISIVSDENTTKMGDAVIARLEFSLISGEKSDLEKISLNNVPVTEITRDKAGEMFPDFSGDDNVWLQYGSEYDYTLSFSQEDHLLSKFSVDKEYDIDWTTKK